MMRSLVAFILVLQGAHAADVKARLQSVLKASSIPTADLGLEVMEVGGSGHEPLLALNADQPMIPASITKLATASAVLQGLGPTFKLQTTLQSTAAVEAGVLKGDLVLKGGGDASFVSETMWFLVNELVRTGIKRIQGDLVVDDADFDDVRTDESRDPERVDRAYDAPVGAMSFNWNSINVYVRPTEKGHAPQVILDPLGDYYEVDNRAQTVAGSGLALEYSRVGHRLTVRGTIGVDHSEAVAYKNIDDPADWSGQALRTFLSQRGISVTGQVRRGPLPGNSRILAKADGHPISQSVADMLKFSNNYVAEMLTKDLAAQNGVHPASLSEGMKLVRAHLNQKVGLSEANYTLINPSGLSRRNRLRARDLMAVLLQAERHFPTFAEYLSSLSLAGLDGTLHKRLKGDATVGWIRAKTGSLSGVVALAGFAGQPDGRVRAFVFMFNGKTSGDDGARHLFDALATELVQ